MTNSYEWGLVREPVPEQTTGVTFMDSDGIIGVYSRSKKVPIKEKNFPDEYADFSTADSYQDWRFTFYVKDDSAPQPTQTQTNSKEKSAK